MRATNCCFVPGCRSGYRSEKERNKKNGVKNPTMFRVPKDPNLLEIWAVAINRSDRPIAGNDGVCELHFHESEINRYFETKLPGGVIHRIPRQIASLKKNAIPSIFPQFNVEKCHKKRKGCATMGSLVTPLNVNGNMVTEESEKSYQEICDESMCPTEGLNPANNENFIDLVPSLFNFQVLVKEAHSILLPSNMWTVGVLKGNRVIFAKWSDGEIFEAKKKVLIDEELHVKVIFGNVTLSLSNIKEVHSLEDAVTFLLVIDQLNLCKSAEKGTNSRSRACLGYTLPRNFMLKEESSSQCRRCQNARKDLVSVSMKKELSDVLENQKKSFKKFRKSSQKSDHLQKEESGRVVLASYELQNRMLPANQGQQNALEPLVIISEGTDKDLNNGSVGDSLMKEVYIEEWMPPPERNSPSTPPTSLPTCKIGPPLLPGEVVAERTEEATNPLDVEMLVGEAHRIPLPSNAWTLGVVKGKCLVFASWRDREVIEAEKRVVIDENLSVKVIFGNKILSLDDIKVVHKIEDVGHYLYIVDKLNRCKGLGTGWRTYSCPGYFLPAKVAGTGAYIMRCAFCQGGREELIRMRRNFQGFKGESGWMRAQAQEKVWRNLNKLTGLYLELRKVAKDSLP